MSDLEDYSRRVDGLDSLSAAEQVRFFCWFLHDIDRKSHFGQSDVTRCFTELGISKPGSIGAYLAKMTDRRELLKERQGYRLERGTMDDLRTKYGQRPATVQVHKLLADLPAKITNAAEREFLDETLYCFQHRAYRAAVVMAWNLAYSHLCDYVFTSRLADFNARLAIVFPKEKLQIVGRDDFSELKESQVLTVCRSATITTPSLGRLLEAKLALRNAAAHPSGVKLTQITAEAAIIELVENVLLKY